MRAAEEVRDSSRKERGEGGEGRWVALWAVGTAEEARDFSRRGKGVGEEADSRLTL